VSIDDAMSSLTSSIQAYVAARGNQTVLANWLLGQLRLSDPGIALALINGVGRMVANPPDRRSFVSGGSSAWILASGAWDDGGTWDDAAMWKDAA
jgi:hypothetical protein